MTQKQLIEQIKQLPITDRVALIEAISRSLREELEADGRASLSDASLSDGTDERARRVSAVSRLRGIAKSDGPPRSDEELKEDYTRYLAEKYS